MRDDIHVIDPNWEHGLALLQEHIRRAPTITFEIVSSVIARGCLRFHVQNPAAKARAARLIESSAFADAALTLLELEMPQWTIRRLVYDEGRWLLTLETGRRSLRAGQHGRSRPPGSVIRNIERACGRAPVQCLILECGRPLNSVPQVQLVHGQSVCCDNFS